MLLGILLPFTYMCHQTRDESKQFILHQWSNPKCTYIKQKYKCDGSKYNSWFNSLQDHFTENIANSIDESWYNKSVLFLGNSHTRQIYDCMLCQAEDYIVNYTEEKKEL